MSEPAAIVTCPAERRRETLIWLFEQGPGAPDPSVIDDWLAQADESDAVAEGLLTAVGETASRGAALTTLLPGQLASITPPRVAEGALQCLASLVAASVDYAERRGARVAQAVLTPRHPAAAAFEQAGFRPARLLLLGRDATAADRAPRRETLEFHPFGDVDELASLVEATYESTLDCAWMNGWRDARDVLATSRATGVYDPRLWFVVRSGAETVGCLLLSDHPQGDALELVYMGVLPARRGRGLGRAMVDEALRVCRSKDRGRLLLFVDADNWPARNAYVASGLAEWDERVCWLRRL